VESVAFQAADGFRLSGDWVEPEPPRRAVAVVAGAMGVRRRFYQAFATFLAENGVATLTFDYRGVGGSRPAQPLPRFRAELHEWGERDLAAALEHASTRHRELPLAFVGHSVGGQILGLAPNASSVRAALFVASQSGYWALWPLRSRWRMVLIWHVAVPAVSRMIGYLPMSRLGGGEDVPKGVALEWARWARHPRYVLSWAEERDGACFAAIDCPLRSLAISDDHFYAPRRAVEALLGMYPAARSELKAVTPADAGVRAIGHFGFFKEVHRGKLWPEAVAWLVGAVSQDASTRRAFARPS
jgi:predicted alpha/beta hydrolase